MATFNDIMKASIFQQGRGSFITPEVFENKVSKDYIAYGLVEFTKERLLIHVARGLYYYPKLDENKKQIKPSLSDIVDWFTSKYNDIAIPDFETALTLIGIADSQSVQTFHTKNRNKKLSLIPRGSINFIPSKKVADVNFENYRSYVAISTLKNIGEKKVTNKIIDLIKIYLSPIPEDQLLRDLESAPKWITKLIYGLNTKNNQ